MKYSDFLQFVEEKTACIIDDELETYEVSFFKIYLKFQQFVGELFVDYATGTPSEMGYLPTRLLIFPDAETMNAFLCLGGKRYVDYYEYAIQYGNIFFGSDNPFRVANEISNYKLELSQMKAVRNFFAHESREAKVAFIDRCLYGGEFVSVGKYLSSLRKEEKTVKISNFGEFIETMKSIASIVQDRISL